MTGGKYGPHSFRNRCNAALDAIARKMDAGAIELLDANGQVLAELPLSAVAAKDASGGELVFNRIEEATAERGGDAQFARVVDASGIEVVFSCDVGDERSNAVIKLSGTTINRGAPVRISSFRLVMP